MRTNLARGLIAIVVVTLAACTSPTSNKQATNGTAQSGPANTVGITPDAVTVSLIVADLSILTKQHLAPDLGDPLKTANAVVDEINAKGGVAGRKLVLKPHTIENAPITTQALLQKICTQATEEDKPLAVVIAPAVPQPIVECTAVTHDQLAIAMDSWPQKLYDDAKGRIYSLAAGQSVSIDRLYGFVPTLLKEKHVTDGKTLGMINQDQPPDRTAAGAALKKSLAAAGLSLAAETTVPLPEGAQTCSQPDVAIQNMKNNHVDLVFLVAQALSAAAIVQAADKADFKPQWVTLGNNVTDTVAQFMAPAKDNYDGAIGIGSVFPTATPEAMACNELVARRANLHFAPGSDAYGFAAVVCMQIQILAEAVNKAEAPLSQGSVMKTLDAMGTTPVNTGPPGSLSATKHDAADFVFLEKYSAAEGKFVPTDTTPQRVPLMKDIAALTSTVLDEETRRATASSEREDALLAGGETATLELRGVDFSYGKVQVLFDIDLAIRAGETVALLGSNGAGKSTLLRVISGLNAPSRGSVTFQGDTITATAAEQRVRRGIVQLIGGEATFPALTVGENLRAGAHQYGRREAKERVDTALDLFPMLQDRRDARAANLSGGQQHMLALAIALMHDPQILLIDELSLGLAPVIVQQVLDVVRELKARKLTMVLVEQSLDVALDIADRAVFIEKGEIRFAGSARELATRDDLVRSVFLGK